MSYTSAFEIRAVKHKVHLNVHMDVLLIWVRVLHYQHFRAAFIAAHRPFIFGMIIMRGSLLSIKRLVDQMLNESFFSVSL